MNTSDDKKLNTEEEKKKLTDILSDKGEIPVLHVHQEDEDGSMYPLAKGTQRVDENGNKIFTFPGQDDKGHRKAQTEYCLVRFGVGGILGQTTSNPHKQWVFNNRHSAIMLDDSTFSYLELNAA